MSESLVIIPAYNEKENIVKIIESVFSLPQNFHVLIVDDNSPDGTAAIVKELQNKFSGNLFLEERAGKAGLGTAYIHGFKWGLKKGYEFIFEMDADFSHNPNDLPLLLDACKNNGADLAIGSRYVKGVTVVNWPIWRVIMSYYASAYVRLITRMPVRDATAGFKCYRRKVLETINLDKIKFIGYAFQIEMKFTAWKFGFNLMEVPVIFVDRKEGKSKMHSGIFSEAFFGVIEMKIKSWFTKYKNPMDS
ncbi:MAG: polyprenol monophosphomannose synthase [Bacteroidia bacterium]